MLLPMAGPPRLLLDLYKLHNPYSGLGQFSQALASHVLALAPPKWHIDLLLPPGRPWPSDQPRHQIQARAWMRYLPQGQPRYDLWHSLHQFPAHLPHPDSPQLLTVHDLNFLVEKSPRKAQRYHMRLQRHVDRAQQLVTISQHSARAMQQHLDLGPRPLYVIPNGVATAPADRTGRPGWLPAGPYFCSIGIFSAKKNFHVLLPLMQHFPQHQLLLAGQHQTAYGARIRAQISDRDLGTQVQLPGEISEADKWQMYRHADALLFPSLAEGFGLPVIEALSCGTPVFLSRYTSLPEVGGEVAYYFDHFGADHLASTLQRGLSQVRQDPAGFARRAQAQAARFGWERCARAYLKLYAQMLGDRAP